MAYVEFEHGTISVTVQVSFPLQSAVLLAPVSQVVSSVHLNSSHHNRSGTLLLKHKGTVSFIPLEVKSDLGYLNVQ